jgi:hypothetical protein
MLLLCASYALLFKNAALSAAAWYFSLSIMLIFRSPSEKSTYKRRKTQKVLLRITQEAQNL